MVSDVTNVMQMELVILAILVMLWSKVDIANNVWMDVQNAAATLCMNV